MRASAGLAVAFSIPLAMIACGLDDSAIVANQNTGGGGNDGAVGGDGTISGGDGGGGDSGGGTDSGSGGDSSGGGGDSGSSTDSGSGPKLVYANTETDVWSYDVGSKVLKKLAAISCAGSHPADLAIDGAGQGYIDEANDAVYKISFVDGTCTARNVLDAYAGDDIHITARAAGTPGFLAVDPQNSNLLGLDPASAGNAHIASLQTNYFADNVPYDVVCNAAGACWTAVAHNNCSSGSGNACLYSFPADGSSAPVSRGAIGVIPAGLAYANGSLYAFGDDGRIYLVNTTGTPSAVEQTPSQIVGAAAEPSQWYGAASTTAF